MSDDARVARNVRRVRQFIDAWGAIDPDAAMACLSQDIVYINQPLPPVLGQTDVRKIVAGIMKLSKKVHWELRNCFGHGNVVVTERLELPCIGMFDLDADGLICGWRDYFDNKMWFENGGPTLHV
jgi:limonene-1,2-epoxide hydrolase